MASSGPPGRLSEKHFPSDLPEQAPTSVGPGMVSMPRSRRIRPRLTATLRLDLPQLWITSRKLAPRLAIEDRDQTLVSIPLHRALGGNPVGAARPACPRPRHGRHRRSWRRAASRCRRSAAAGSVPARVQTAARSCIRRTHHAKENRPILSPARYISSVIIHPAIATRKIGPRPASYRDIVDQPRRPELAPPPASAPGRP